jgi:hypothetical protein
MIIRLTSNRPPHLLSIECPVIVRRMSLDRRKTKEGK